MTALPRSTKVLWAYRAAKKAAKEAHETYVDAKDDADRNHARLLNFSKIVIGSVADLNTVIRLKETHETWQVEVELLRKYKPHGQNKSSVKRLRHMAAEARIPFLAKKIRA